MLLTIIGLRASDVCQEWRTKTTHVLVIFFPFVLQALPFGIREDDIGHILGTARPKGSKVNRSASPDPTLSARHSSFDHAVQDRRSVYESRWRHKVAAYEIERKILSSRTHDGSGLSCAALK